MIVQIAVDFFGPGAIDRRVRQEVMTLVSAGYDVAVITAKPQAGLEKPFLENLSEERIQLIYVASAFLMRLRKFLGAVPEILFASRCYDALNRLNRQGAIDLIISHAATPCYAVARFCKKEQKIPTAYVIHALIWDRINASANPHNWLDTQVYKSADHYALSRMDYSISVSDYIRKLAIAKGAIPANALVFYNPVDTKIFKSDLSIATKDIDVLFIGRLSVEKGLQTLMAATQYLPEKTRVVIIGKGSLRQQLESQVQQSACYVELKGWVDNQLLPQYIERAKLFVVPSLTEPQGVVVLEAMACGVPVIASDIGGIPEMIRHGENGWLVPPGDAQALANTIQLALADEQTRSRIAVSALETAQSFSVERFCQQLPSFYQNLIDGGQLSAHP